MSLFKRICLVLISVFIVTGAAFAAEEQPTEVYTKYTLVLNTYTRVADAQSWWTLAKINRDRGLSLEQIRAKTPTRGVSFGTMKIVSDVATFDVNGTSNSGKVKGIVTMHRVGGMWKIDDEKF